MGKEAIGHHPCGIQVSETEPQLHRNSKASRSSHGLTIAGPPIMQVNETERKEATKETEHEHTLPDARKL